ncbi:TetR/AcrR family transcriptional regulator [Gulosibacter chungangensis]|uniref:Helix-turn-helix transcriptional regulator n=1 Tax=Gulosibacter chungangensis TaxID=979746 RepID=A0A7J5BBL5_9MICO|nr:helix-turn-helix domain-containing protein [Gulosibacter chungangensis]KAB1643532.1 helix-turn-helix transcriptional regulator [Gulosibacter chungangensis]
MPQPASTQPTKRGPRGDISRARILDAADRLLREKGTVEGVSLRAIAAGVGIAPNAMYTYFASLSQLWHDLGDQRLGMVRPEELLTIDCRYCALLELAQRGLQLTAIPGTMSLLRTQPILGPNSFRLSETILELTADASINPRDAHDLLLAWFYGGIALAQEGWTSGTDEIRGERDLSDFPLIAGRADPDTGAQLRAIFRGIGIVHSCGLGDE